MPPDAPRELGVFAPSMRDFVAKLALNGVTVFACAVLAIGVGSVGHRQHPRAPSLWWNACSICLGPGRVYQLATLGAEDPRDSLAARCSRNGCGVRRHRVQQGWDAPFVSA